MIKLRYPLFCRMQQLAKNLLFIILLSGAFAACKTQKSVPQKTTVDVVDSAAVTPVDTIIFNADTVAVLAADSLPSIDTLSIPLERKDSIRFAAVGDIMLGTNFPESYYLPPNEGREMLQEVTSAFSDSDIVFGNLEGVLLDSGGTQKECRNPKTCYLFRSPEYMGDRLAEAGFNLFSVANNHAGDFGPEGRANTSKVLDSLGIPHAGNIERPYTIFEKEGITYGFAAFSPNKGTPNINDLKGAINIVAHLDSLTDIIIISFHGGAEGSNYTSVPREHEYFYGEDRGDVYNFAHTLVDAGADVIFGHGPHVPRAIDIYKDRFIAYSLGNFATYARFNLRGPNGLAPIIKLVMNNEGRFLSGQILSYRQYGRGVPKPDLNNGAAELIRELTKKDLPEVEITIDESGFISYLHP